MYRAATLRAWSGLLLISMLISLIPPTTPNVVAAPAPSTLRSMAVPVLPPIPLTTPSSTSAHAQIPAEQRIQTGFQIVTLPHNNIPFYDQMWRYTNGTWISFAPPLRGVEWKAIAADPYDYNHLLVLANAEHSEYHATNGYVRREDGRDPLWETVDGGATWQPVPLPAPVAGTWRLDWNGLAFDTSQLSAWRVSASVDGNATYLYRGHLFSAGSPEQIVTTGCYTELVHLAAGVDGDTLLYSETGNSCGWTWQSRGLSYVPRDSTTNLISGGILFSPPSSSAPRLGIIARLPGASHAVVGIHNINGSPLDLYATDDYRNNQVSFRRASVGGSLAAAVDGVFIGDRTGILQIPDVLGAPESGTIISDTLSVGAIQVDSQTHQTVVAITSDLRSFLVRSAPGSTWQTLAIPDGASMSGLFTVLPGRGAFSKPLGSCPTCQHVPHIQVGEPIDTRTGNVWRHEDDLSILTADPTLSFARSYASQASGDPAGAFGPGWTHTYAARLITSSMPGGEAGMAIIVSPSGNWQRYRALGSGYAPTPGVRGTLIESSTVITQTLPSQDQWAFDRSTGQVLRVQDAVGHVITMGYDASGRLTQVVDASDPTRALTLTYTAGSQIQQVSDGTRAVTYGYSASGDLQTVTDVAGRTRTYIYQNHLLTQVINALGQVEEATTYDSYGPTGRAIQQTQADGRLLQLMYTTDSTTVTTTGTDGSVDIDVYRYDNDDTLIEVSHNGEVVQATSFDGGFSPGVVSDGNGNLTTTSFTAQGLPLAQTNALGQTTRIRYDDQSHPLQVTDTLDVQSHYRYNAQGQVIRQTTGITTTFPLGFTTLYTYTNAFLTAQRDPAGVVTQWDRNAQGQVLTVTLGLNAPSLAQRTGYGYDALGRVVTTTVGVGTGQERQDVTDYNDDNTVAATIQNYVDGVFAPNHPDEDLVTTYGYDLLGRPIWVRDGLGRYTVTHYNAAGQVDWTAQNLTGYSGGTSLPATPPAFAPAQPDANVAAFYAYDGLGRTSLVTQTGILTGTFSPTTRTFSAATTRTTRTEYDALSRPITVTLNYQPGVLAGPDVNVQLLTFYDGAGNVIWQRDALGRWTRTQYDALSRPITVTLTYENGDPLTIDPINVGTAITDTDVIHVTAYRPDGQVDFTIDRYVDGAFNPAEPDRDRKTVYQYDTLGRPTTTIRTYVDGDPATGTTDTDIMQTTAYDALGRVQASQDALGRWVSQQYDALSRVTTTIQNCRDANGPMATGCAAFAAGVPDQNVPSTTHYDGLDRAFETVDALGHVTRSSYDILGRTTATTRNYVVGTPADSDTNITTSQTYDALGRVVTQTDALGVTTSQTYDALGRVITATDGALRVSRMGDDGTGAQRWRETPDGRFTVSLVDGLGRVTTTIQNYQDGVVGTHEPVDQDLITRTVYDVAGRRTATIDPAGRETRFTYDLNDQLLTVTENAADSSCARALQRHHQLRLRPGRQPPQHHRCEQSHPQLRLRRGRPPGIRDRRAESDDRLPVRPPWSHDQEVGPARQRLRCHL